MPGKRKQVKEAAVDSASESSGDESLDEFENDDDEINFDGSDSDSDNGIDSEAEGRGVIYLGHIPYGFFENQMKTFFAQFGTVTRLRLSRNKKTGRSKHFAFIEFSDEGTADVVAKAMDGYLMYSHRMVCKVIPSDKVHKKMFAGASHKFRHIPARKIERERHNRDKTPQETKRTVNRLVAREAKRKEKLAALGIDYQYKGFTDQIPKESEHIHFSESESEEDKPVTPVAKKGKSEAAPTPKKSPVAQPKSAEKKQPQSAKKEAPKTVEKKTPAKVAVPAKRKADESDDDEDVSSSEEEQQSKPVAKGKTPAKTPVAKTPAKTPVAKAAVPVKTPAKTPVAKSAPTPSRRSGRTPGKKAAVSDSDE